MIYLYVHAPTTLSTLVLCFMMRCGTQEMLGEVGVSLPLSAITVFAYSCDENGDGWIDFGLFTPPTPHVGEPCLSVSLSVPPWLSLCLLW